MTITPGENQRLIAWGITLQCNLSCPHCYSAATKRAHDELNTAECKKIIESLAVVNVKFIGWTGGEPLLRKDLEELIIFARDHGIRSGVTTNGVLLTEKRAAGLKEAGLKSIQISLDGSTSDWNNRMRAASERQYRRVIDGIVASKKIGLGIHMAMLVGQENLDDAAPFVEMAKSLGVNTVRFCGYVPWGSGKSNAVQDRLAFTERLCELRETVEKLQTFESFTVMFDPAFGPTPPDYRFHECISGVGTFYISHNGDVYPCTALLDKQFKVGNLRERSIADLLADPNMTRISSYPRKNITGPCRECPRFQDCRGACRGITYAHTGDLNASFPVCLLRTEPEYGAVAVTGRREGGKP